MHVSVFFWRGALRMPPIALPVCVWTGIGVSEGLGVDGRLVGVGVILRTSRCSGAGRSVRTLGIGAVMGGQK